MLPKLTIKQVKNIIIGLVVLGVLGGLAYYRNGYQASKPIVQSAAKDVKKANQTTVQAVKGSEVDQAAVVATANRVSDNAEHRVKNEQQTHQRLRQIDQQHQAKPATADSARERSEEISRATIDSIWRAYCDVQPSTDCKG